ncbi:glycosyltransferase family 4 protein [Saccharothrix xinjiangensis]|uniref:Glycosyltransferase family 4 protein n=1 Tax=Saccharothrix xinjiangensis TaxID=204798 RepID=A0ABV9XTC6_9PSEU
MTDSYPPAPGGLERAVRVLSRELAARGHHVEVASLSRPGSPAFERAGGVVVRRFTGWTRHLRRFSTDPDHQFHPTVADPPLVRSLQGLVDATRPDVVHAHGWILHSCLRLRLPPDAALVVSLHDYGLVCAKKTMTYLDDFDSRCAGPSPGGCLGCAGAFYGSVKGTALALGLVLARRSWDRVAMFLPISAAVARACLPGVAPDRIRVIPPPAADDAASPQVPRPGFLPDGDFVLFVGALGEHKGVSLLLRAHQRMATPVPLVVIGPRRADTPEFTGTAGRPVVVRDEVSHQQVMAAFAAASVVAVPSRWPEPHGLVAVEAMASGTAVVASRTGGLAEVVEHDVTGCLVEPGDADALAGALDDLLADPARRRRMGAAGAVRACRYQSAAVVPRVVEAYADARALLGR